MPFAQESGYTPKTFEEIISEIREGINTQFGTTYTEEDFLGTNYYKYAYVLGQRVQLGEVKASEIFQKLQQYFAITNEKVQRPSVSWPGMEESFEANGYIASVKPPLEADAGKISVCMDVDGDAGDYEDEVKPEILQLLSQFIVGGVVTEGPESGNVVISNGQSFEYKFFLPTEVPVLLRATVTVSENSPILPPNDEDLRNLIKTQIEERYRLGKNFEPQRYFNQSDAPWASDVILEYSLNAGVTWTDDIYNSEFDEKIVFELDDIDVEGLPS